MKLIKQGLLLILIAISVCSYLPQYFNNAGQIVGGLATYVAAITIVLFLCSITFPLNINHQIIKIYIFYIFVIIFCLGLYYSLTLIDSNSFGMIATMTIPLIAIIIGYKFPYTQNFMHIGLCVFIIFILYVGFKQIAQNIGGLIIADQYLISAKNSVGALLAIGGTCSMLNSFNIEECSKRYRIFMILCSLAILIELLTIRARLATLSYLAISAYIIYKYLRAKYQKSTLPIIILLFLLLSTIYFILPDATHEYVYNSFFQNKEDDFFSERDGMIRTALEAIYTNPFWGNLSLQEHLPWIHNYILLRLANYGIIGSLPWIGLYVFLAYQAFIHIKSTSITKIKNYGYILLLIPFAVSLGEPTFPYGPGTVTFIPFFMLGVAIQPHK